MIRLISPKNGATLSHLHDVQRDFFAHSEEYSDPAFEWRQKFDFVNRELTIPSPFIFSWETDEEDAVFLLTEAESGREVFRQVGGSTAEVYNLLLGTAYRWQVGDSETRTFTTDGQVPRWIRLDGTVNVRDIGGWKTMDGQTVRQGLFYRGCEMDRALFITDEGLRAAREDLGIRTDIDLRGEMVGINTQSPLGPDVRYELFSARAYGECIELPDGIEVAGRIFNILADPEAYPVYLHCAAGADRTGTFAYLLLTLLGVSAEDVAKEYELTTLSNQSPRTRHSPFYQSILDDLSKHGGDPTERVENYLIKTCGVSEEAVARIRKIFLG